MREPSKPRRRRVRYSRVRQDALIMAFVGIMSIMIIITLGTALYMNVKDAEVIVNQLHFFDRQLIQTDSQIRELQLSQPTVLNNVYTTVKKECQESDDPVLKELWEKEFPTDDVFRNNPEEKMVSIYAVFDLHKDIRYSVNVAQALYDMGIAQDMLQIAVDRYNEQVDSYKFWAEEYKDNPTCKWVDGTIDTKKYVSKLIVQ